MFWLPMVWPAQLWVAALSMLRPLFGTAPPATPSQGESVPMSAKRRTARSHLTLVKSDPAPTEPAGETDAAREAIADPVVTDAESINLEVVEEPAPIAIGQEQAPATPFKVQPVGADDTPDDDRQRLRVLEAILFAATEPVDETMLERRLGAAIKLRPLLLQLKDEYAARGINLIQMDKRWAFRTAADLAPYLRVQEETRKKPSRAATETLAIIAYHQPVTRAEIESIRGVATSKGTLDLLMESGWIRPGRRRETPGRPLTWLTTDEFLDQFGLTNLRDLPGVEDLRAAGLLDPRPVLANIRRTDDVDGEDSGDEGEADD